MSETATSPARGQILPALPPGPAADLLAEAAALVPAQPARLLEIAREAAALADGDALTEAVAKAYQGFAHYLTSDHHVAAELLTEAVAEAEPLGDLSARFLGLSVLAGVHVSLGHYDEALSMAANALAMARALGDREREGWMLASIGNVYLELGRPELALENSETALRIFAEIGEENGQARAHTVMGGALQQLARYPEAEAHFVSALHLAENAAADLTVARATDDLGALATARGRPEAALGFHARALQMRRALDARQAQATSLIGIGRAHLALEQPDEAVAPLQEALALAEETGAEPRAVDALDALADAHEALGDPARALALVREAQRRRSALLDAQTRSRVHLLELRAETERVRADAEIARVRTEELGAANAELKRTLADLKNAQGRLVQAEKLASLGRLASGLAHEISNPLNFVVNFAELNRDLAGDLLLGVRALRAGGEPPDLDAVQTDLEAIAENAERVRANARRAEHVVRSLMSHVHDAGGDRRPVDLHALLESARTEALADAPGIALDLHLGADPPDVLAAPGALRRALVALLDNARRAVRDADAPRLTLRTDRRSDEVTLSIRDNGVGIAPEHCARVFEPFFTTRPPGEGLGLGLSLAYDIVVNGHDGRLYVSSRPGEGATFTVRLPVAERTDGGEE